jgi:DNA-binding IclR family transcriptional regulator
MQALNEATGETINLAILLGHEVEQIGQVDCTFHVGGMNWGNSRVPLHCSALGKAFLAYGAQLPPGPLERLTPKSITDLRVLQMQLEDIRNRGWALADSELEMGLIAIAAPIFVESGQMIGALSISGPTMRMTREVTNQYADLLVKEASAISEKFGYAPALVEHPTSGKKEIPGSQPAQVRRRVGAA